MDIVLIILGIWLVPGIAAYILGGLYSHEWSIEKEERVLLYPVVNIVVLGIVLIMLFDEYVVNRIWR